jgi:hypothetical protein
LSVKNKITVRKKLLESRVIYFPDNRYTDFNSMF